MLGDMTGTRFISWSEKDYPYLGFLRFCDFPYFLLIKNGCDLISTWQLLTNRSPRLLPQVDAKNHTKMIKIKSFKDFNGTKVKRKQCTEHTNKRFIRFGLFLTQKNAFHFSVKISILFIIQS
jgi:hypothetical protein